MFGRGAPRETGAAFPPGSAWLSYWGSKADFTNEMGLLVGNERVRSNGHPCPCFLKPPFMAVLPWVLGHFISEIFALLP